MKLFAAKFMLLMTAGRTTFLILNFAADYHATVSCLNSGKVYDYALNQYRDDIDHLPITPDVKQFRRVIVLSAIIPAIGIAFVARGAKGLDAQALSFAPFWNL